MSTDEDQARALAEEARVPFSSLEGAAPDAQAAALIPEDFARRGTCVAIAAGPAGRTLVAQANPFDVVTIDELQRIVPTPIDLVCAPARAIERLLDRAYGPGTSHHLRALVAEGLASLDRPFEDDAGGMSPIVRLVDQLVEDAVLAGATNLHLEPEELVVHVRHRVDGVLRQVDTLPRELQPPIVSRLKVLAGLDIAEQRLPQEGRITQPVRRTPGRLQGVIVPDGVRREGRYPHSGARQAVQRARGPRAEPPRARAVPRPARAFAGDHPGDRAHRRRQDHDAVPALNVLGGRARNIMTVEDPVEYEFPSIRQTQIRPRAGLTFATAIRSLLRQDPDVIMIGEIRDPETAQLAVRAALSGALVFSTLHTQDAAGAVPRLMDMGVEPYLLASTIAGVIAQRLVRLVCPACRAAGVVPGRDAGESRPVARRHRRVRQGRRVRGVRGDGLPGTDGGLRNPRDRRRDARSHRRSR